MRPKDADKVTRMTERLNKRFKADKDGPFDGIGAVHLLMQTITSNKGGEKHDLEEMLADPELILESINHVTNGMILIERDVASAVADNIKAIAGCGVAVGLGRAGKDTGLTENAEADLASMVNETIEEYTKVCRTACEAMASYAYVVNVFAEKVLGESMLARIIEMSGQDATDALAEAYKEFTQMREVHDKLREAMGVDEDGLPDNVIRGMFTQRESEVVN